MNHNKPGTVIKLVGSKRSDQPTVADRIKQRKAVLSEWLKEGIPLGKRRNLPNSLRSARDWDDPEIGISPIASPNDFTQKHPLHGKDVREIARLLTEIEKRYAKQKFVKKKRTPDTAFDKREAASQLVHAVSQWNAERHARLSEQKRADGAEMRANIVLRENAELRRMLSVYKGPTIVS